MLDFLKRFAGIGYKKEQGIPAKVIKEVEQEADKLLKDEPRGRGFCHVYWGCKKELFKDRGYDWKSPQDLNPYTHFD